MMDCVNMNAIPIQKADQRPKESTTPSVQSIRVGRMSVSLSMSWKPLCNLSELRSTRAVSSLVAGSLCAMMTSGLTSGSRKNTTGNSAV